MNADRIKNRAFTLVELLIVLGILGVMGTFLMRIFLGGAEGFNDGMWRQHISNQGDRGLQLVSKYLRLASYPSLNTARGVLTDRSTTWGMVIPDDVMNRDEAYTQALRNLSEKDGEGGVNYDQGAAKAWFYGSGLRSGLSEGSGEEDVLRWTSCKPGYEGIPGFADLKPYCAQHRIYLKNRLTVRRANPDTYQFYQDLYMHTVFCTDQTLNPDGGNIGYLQGKGLYQATTSSFHDNIASLPDPDQKTSAGHKLLCANVAAVGVKVFQKPNDRSKSMEVEIIAVAPFHGNSVVRRSIQVNLFTSLTEGSGAE